MRSIRQRLMLGLLGVALGGTALGGLLLYKNLRHEANELSDQQLRQVAATLPAQLRPGVEQPLAGEPGEQFFVEAWNGAKLVYASPGMAALPRQAAPGLVSARVDGRGWRMYAIARPGQWLQVAQPNRVREALAGRMALRVLYPLCLLLPLLGGLVFLVVGRALRPLDQLATAVALRSPSALQPLPLAGLSPELVPIAAALNTLLLQIEQALLSQRAFIADAAHELRSPLTALKLQLQLAQRAADGPQREGAFIKLHERLDRASHLVRQLLAMARHEDVPQPARWGGVDLQRLLEQVVGDYSALADSKRIDLGIDATSLPVTLQADGEALGVLLSNLVDNALGYTPAGGQVDVLTGIERGRAFLSVRDNGPGVPQELHARLCDRFYRPDGNDVPGCGLGLAIVKNIAGAHRATVKLRNRGGGGLQVTILFPHGLATDTPMASAA